MTTRYKLHLGDCLEILPGMDAENVSAVIADPPYGIALASNGQWFKKAGTIVGDEDTRVAETVYGMCADRNWPLAMFFSPYRWFTNGWRSVLVWNKGKHVGVGGDRETCWLRDIEMIGVAFNRALNGRRDSSVLSFNAIKISSKFVGLRHPAEKPLPLMRYLVKKLTNLGDTVVDPTMGCGTTGVACMELRRKFIGCEIDPAYYKLAEKRIRETPYGSGLGLLREPE